jgi:hypothetical protein
MMAIDYDAADTPPGSKVQIMSYADAKRVSPWDRVAFDAKPSDLHKFGIQRFVRSETVGGDIKTFDIGNFFISTQNTPPDATSLGELYVEYTIRLYTPQINSGLAIPYTQEAQQTTITLPQGKGAASLVATYFGLGNSPLAWLDPTTLTNINPTLLINGNVLRNMLGIFKSNSNDFGFPYRSFANMAPTGALRFAIMGAPFESSTTPNELFKVYKISNSSTFDAGGGIFPLQLVRNTSRPLTLEFALLPNASDYQRFSHDIPSSTFEYAFPEIDIPKFNPVSSSSFLGRKTTVLFSEPGNRFIASDGQEIAR